MYRPVGLCLLCQLALVAPAAAAAEEEGFDCVIEPAVMVRVGGQVSGLLEIVLVNRGDRVTQGQVIARLSSQVEEATVALLSEQAASTSEIEAQKARSQLAVNRAGRTRILVERNVQSRDKLEEAVAEMEVVKRELAIAEMRLRIAALELNRARKILELKIIRSPIDGVVVERSLFKGEFLDQDGKVATIAQLDPLHVETFLPVSYFGKVHQGMSAKVSPNEPIRGTYSGIVSVIDQVFDAASGTFGVRVELRNPGHQLPAGHRCRITFDGLSN